MPKKWAPLNRVAKAVYAFTPQDTEIGKYQMRLEKNDIVVILSENSGWYKGHLKDDPKVNGMFPANYVKLQDESDTAKTHRQRGDTVMAHDTTTTELSEAEQEQRLLEEVDSTIKEWIKVSRSLLADSTKESAESNYFRIKSNIGMMMHWRGKLVSKSCSPAELGECKMSLNKMLEGARRSQAGFLVPKTLHSMIQSGEKIHGPNFGIVGLYDMHYQMKKDFVDNSNVPERYPSKTMHQVSIEDAFTQKKTKILSEKRKKINPMAHLYLEYNASPMSLNSPFEIYFSLFSKPKEIVDGDRMPGQRFKARPRSMAGSVSGRSGKFISEEFLVYVTSSGLPQIEFLDKLKTVFVNVETKFFDHRVNDLYLVCKVYRVGDLELPKSTGHKSSSMQDSSKLEVSPKFHVYRRPYGVGVTSLTNCVSDLLNSAAPTKDITVLTPTKESFTEERFESLHLAAIDEYLGNAKSSTRNENPRLPSWAQKGGIYCSSPVRFYKRSN